MTEVTRNLSWQELRQMVWASVVLGVCVVGLGSLLAHLAGVLSLRKRRQNVLWTLALGIPATVFISVWIERYSSRTAGGVFALALSIAGGALFVNDIFLLQKPHPFARLLTGKMTALYGVFALLAAFCVVECVDVQIGSRLYLSSLLPDWSVRLAMTRGAMRSGVPPLNGLSTLSVAGVGHAPHLRYYYFWYVLLAQIAGSLHLGAMPTLTAGCVWACWSFLAVCLLALRYLTDLRNRWEKTTLVLVLLFCVLGLDILPTSLMWLSPHFHPLLEMEWWRSDRTPSFLGMLLASPHHIASITCLLAGTLLLFTMGHLEGEQHRHSRLLRLRVSITAGLCFAAAAGLALFPTFCFAVGLSFWAIDLLRRRQWHVLFALAGAGALSLLLAHTYLRELSSGASAANGFLEFGWRNDAFAATELSRILRVPSHEPVAAFFLRQPVVLILDIMELGFFLFAAVAVIQQELLRPGRLSPGRCLWWCLLCGAALPAFFLSSLATRGPNDLGFDAGFLVRLNLQLWAVYWLQNEWAKRHVVRTVWQQLGAGGAIAFAALGLLAQMYQILSIRLYYPVIGSGLVHKQVDTLTNNHLSERLYNIYAALQRFDAETPPSAPDTEAIQFNPIGVLLTPQVYFNTHQIASWDTGCGTSFGGDYARCAPIYSDLLFLYGNTAAGVSRSRTLNTLQDGAASRVANAADLATVCKNLRLRAVVADATDSIWTHHESWVWTTPVIVANSTVRIVSCPAGSWRQ